VHDFTARLTIDPGVRADRLRKNQMPDAVVTGGGQLICRPKEWES
jgi:hypothetical protein